MLIVAAVLAIASSFLIIIGKPSMQETLYNIAQFLAACATILATIQGFWKQIREKYDLIRLQQTSGHIVICGLGDKGMRLVNIFTEKGFRVVIIEAQKDHPDIAGCRERNVVVMIGEASDQVVLDEANTAKAKYLFAVSGDDNANINIAQQGKIWQRLPTRRAKRFSCAVMFMLPDQACGIFLLVMNYLQKLMTILMPPYSMSMKLLQESFWKNILLIFMQASKVSLLTQSPLWL